MIQIDIEITKFQSDMNNTKNTIYSILAFSLCLLLNSSETFGQTSFFTAEYYIDGEKAQDQYYKVVQNSSEITIQERGIFLSNKEIYAFAESITDSLGYKSVSIYFDNGEIKSNVSVKRNQNDSNIYYSFLNGRLVDSILVDDAKVLLFDGPNPSFDALNSAFLKKTNKPNATLGLINWVSGSLSTEDAYFIIGNGKAAIHKKSTNRKSFLDFSKDSNITQILPINYFENKNSYNFLEVESLAIKLKR